MKSQHIPPNTGLNYKQFYKELGRLLYAIASSDGLVHRKEVEALREFVLKELAPFESSYDSSGMNKAFYTQFEFDDMANRHQPVSEAYTAFIQYLHNNASNINQHLRSSIITAIERVAQAYKKTNKKEKEMIEMIREAIESL